MGITFTQVQTIIILTHPPAAKIVPTLPANPADDGPFVAGLALTPLATALHHAGSASPSSCPRSPSSIPQHPPAKEPRAANGLVSRTFDTAGWRWAGSRGEAPQASKPAFRAMRFKAPWPAIALTTAVAVRKSVFFDRR